MTLRANISKADRLKEAVEVTVRNGYRPRAGQVAFSDGKDIGTWLKNFHHRNVLEHNSPEQATLVSFLYDEYPLNKN